MPRKPPKQPSYGGKEHHNNTAGVVAMHSVFAQFCTSKIHQTQTTKQHLPGGRDGVTYPGPFSEDVKLPFDKW